MRSTRLLVLPAAVAVLFAAIGRREPLLTRERIERDLKLIVTPTTPWGRLSAGSPPELSVLLVNMSMTRTYTVLQEGDGSESGRREPHVYFSVAYRSADGHWSYAVPPPRPRCNLLNPFTPDDVVELKPGDRLELTGDPEAIDLQSPGHVRIRAHYDYRPADDGDPTAAAAYDGRMRGVPGFRLTSDPMEFEVVRPFDVRVRLPRSLQVGQTYRMSDVFDVTITGTTHADGAAHVRPDAPGGSLTLHLAGDPVMSFQPDEQPWVLPTKPFRLAPGERRRFFADGLLADDQDGYLYPVAPGVLRVAATYHPQTEWDHSRVRSEWAEVRVER